MKEHNSYLKYSIVGIIAAIVIIIVIVVGMPVMLGTLGGDQTIPLDDDSNNKKSVTISKDQAVITIQNTGVVPVEFLQDSSGIHIKKTHTGKEVKICVVSSGPSKLEPSQEINLVYFACDKFDQPIPYREGSYEIYATCDDGCTSNTIPMTMGNPQEVAYESTVRVPDQTRDELLNLLQGGQIKEFNELKQSAVDDAWLPIESARLNFNGIDLENVNLENANLFRVDLRGTNLKNANLQGANLIFADLQDADLSNAYMASAKLGDALLIGANLEEATLRGANLVKANLQDAVLVHAKLENAFLEYANLQDANLSYSKLNNAVLSSVIFNGANLQNANLQGADLTHAKLLNTILKHVENLPISTKEAIERGAIINQE